MHEQKNLIMMWIQTNMLETVLIRIKFFCKCHFSFWILGSLVVFAGTASYSQEPTSSGTAIEKRIEVYARGTTGQEQLRLLIDDKVVTTWTLSKSMQTYTATSALEGPLRVEFFNDERGRDVRVDYLSIDGKLHQAEDQSINTGAFQNGKCGGGQGRTEWMRCNGYIEFNIPDQIPNQILP